MHNKCTCKPIINKRQVLERVNILKHNLDKITEYAKAYNLNSEIKNFDAEINQLSVEVRDLDSEMYKAFKNENVSKFTEIYEKALGLKYQIDNNWAIKEYAIFKMNRSMLNDRYSLNDKYRILDKKLKAEIEDHKEKLQKEMEEHKNREVQQEAEKIKEEMKLEYQEMVDKLQNDLDQKTQELEQQIEESKKRELGSIRMIFSQFYTSYNFYVSCH